MYYNGEPQYGTDDDKMNKNFKSLLDHNKKDIGGETKKVTDNPRGNPAAGKTADGIMNGNLMTWTQMLENMDEIIAASEERSNSVIDSSIDEPISSSYNTGDVDKDLIAELNQIFTPILVMQGFEGNMTDKIQEAFSEASVLTEKNIIKFDDETRLAQLIATCALLLQKKKNTEKWQMYKKAAAIKNQMKLDMQKEEYNSARALAQKFLVNVSSTNNSSIARQAAKDLLPITT